VRGAVAAAHAARSASKKVEICWLRALDQRWRTSNALALERRAT